ncbi:MAG TPA: hypothetical protein VN428_21320 [Bryobacteraceae bacterium]|nr:hypothetical protein [Bryobacteraceae bacterium]
MRGAAKDVAGLYGILVRHFFGRFFDKEALSPQGEPEANIVQTLGILMVPGAFFVLVLRPLTLMGWSLIMARTWFVFFSMAAMGFIVVLQWDALFPDRRDYQILTPLPLSLTSVFVAKTAALGLFLGIFLIDINVASTLFWPGIDAGGDALNILASHIIAVVAAGLFTALAAAAVQGVLITLLPAGLFRRVSVCLQTVLLAAFVMMVCLTPIAGHVMHDMVKHNNPFLWWFPGFWFIGVYELIRPAVGDPTALALGHRGVQALGWAAAIFVLTYLPGYRRATRKIVASPEPVCSGPGRLRTWIAALLHCTLLRGPVERAAFHFMTQTITRSFKHRLFLAAYAGFGAALVVISFASGPGGALRLPLMLSFVLVSALRAAFNFPSELRANWTFQLSDTDHALECFSAMRKWIAVCAIGPLFLIWAPVEFSLFPWNEAAFHIAFGLTLCVLLIEIMFFGFKKAPFTCSYLPGKVNLVGLGAIYVFGFTTYSDLMAGLEAQLVREPPAAAAFFIAAAAVYCGLVYWRRRTMGAAPALDYEDIPDPVVRTLDLSVR